jgi:hypothetical protein
MTIGAYWKSRNRAPLFAEEAAYESYLKKMGGEVKA